MSAVRYNYDDEETIHVPRKMIFLGGKGVGKSSLVHMLLGDKFNDSYPATSNFDTIIKVGYSTALCDTSSEPACVDVVATQLSTQNDICFVLDPTGGEDDFAQQIASIKMYHEKYLKNPHINELHLTNAAIIHAQPTYLFVTSKIDSNDKAVSFINKYQDELNLLFNNRTRYFFYDAKNPATHKALIDYTASPLQITLSDDDLSLIKTQLAEQLEKYIINPNYIATSVMSLFGHKHNDRAIAVRNAIQCNAKSLEDIYLILINQKRLFLGVPDRELPPALLSERYAKTLINKSEQPLESGFYKSVMKCMELVLHINPGLTKAFSAEQVRENARTLPM